jgi:hypothetical protein
MNADLISRRKWADFWIMQSPDPLDPTTMVTTIYRERAEAVGAAMAHLRYDDVAIIDEWHFQPLERDVYWTSTWWAISSDDGSDQYSVSVTEGRYGEGF